MNNNIAIVKLPESVGGYGVTLDGRLVWAPADLGDRGLNQAKLARIKLINNPVNVYSYNGVCYSAAWKTVEAPQ